ncbi:MAG: ATP synthase subunit alpha 1 [Porticoccaceae bacterium]|nr:MAG: ATP synthase subunit alpha 1 [Porticoccaceae bacterium]
MSARTEPSLLDRRSAALATYRPAVRRAERGTVVSVGDGVVWIEGLRSAALEDVVEFAGGGRGMVFDLGRELVGAVLLEQGQAITAGTVVRLGGGRLAVPVGDGLLGRVLDPLGNPLDGLPPPAAAGRAPIFAPAPPLLERDFVSQPLYTGIALIDALLPIGRGQRQLILGDSGLGRTSLALDAVFCQRNQGVLCVYVSIGQRRSAVVSTLEWLRHHGAMDHTVAVVAEGSALPGLQYLAPYAGCALGEYWMRRGRDVLVVYDDLSSHAVVYRELSLLLARPPGREAYPGDIFSIHARLLERATRLCAACGGGSLTALPLVGTQQGEIAAYIPTNLISITDGQVLLDRELFAAGQLPAVDVRRSVSRIGGKAQHPRIRAEAGRIKLDYLQFLELENFTRLGARLEPALERAIERGRVLRALFVQERFAPLAPRALLALLVAFNEGLFDAVPPARAGEARSRLIAAVDASDLDLDSPRERFAALASAALGEFRAHG